MSVISRVSALFNTVSDFYRDINPSTLSGAIDILVIEHDDGEMIASPFHVRFGKLQVFRLQEHVVEIDINDVKVDLYMKVGSGGEAFFDNDFKKKAKDASSDTEVEYYEETKNPLITLSLCGYKENLERKEFMKSVVSYRQFCEDESILSNSLLTVQINDQFLAYKDAAPLILSILCFQKIPEPVRRKNSWRWWRKNEEKSRSRSLSAIDSEEPFFLKKSLRLSSRKLKSLGLKRGCNIVTFSVVSGFRRTAQCRSRIFLWGAHEKVVISDIDGTITKSDTLGHLFQMVGRDWTHSGVASLYTGIRKNGYQIIYLSSRAIGQAQYTRNYLEKVEQGQFQLPDGPMLLSPDRLMAAFTREVIQRRPEEFKIACLREIQFLFRTKSNPFFAGFGNRSTDAHSYRVVGVPESRIFTINPKGEVKRELLEGFRATYYQLGDLVDHIFPPTSNHEPLFNDWNFWK